MAPPPDDRHNDARSHADLERLLLARLRESRREAVTSGGDVSPEAIESLTRLSKLVQLSREQSIASRRVFIAIFAALSLAISSVLLFARVGETEIDLRAEVSEASFTLARPQVLFDSMVLPFVGVSGLRQIDVPGARDHAAQSWVPADLPSLAVGFAPASSAQEGSVTLTPLELPERTRVDVQRQGPSQRYRLTITGRDLEPSVGLHGAIQIRRSDAAPATFDFSSPDTVHMRAATDTIDLDLAFEAPRGLSPRLEISDLSLVRLEDFRGRQSLVRRLSSVRAGTLYLEALAGKAYTLRAGEFLELSGLSGEVESISLGPETIRLEFRGRVRGASVGVGEGRRSLMPTWLEWLRARHGLTLFWGTATYVFGLVMAGLRFWRAPQ